jgi:hypothetical protein
MEVVRHYIEPVDVWLHAFKVEMLQIPILRGSETLLPQSALRQRITYTGRQGNGDSCASQYRVVCSFVLRLTSYRIVLQKPLSCRARGRQSSPCHNLFRRDHRHQGICKDQRGVLIPEIAWICCELTPNRCQCHRIHSSS